IQAWKDCFAALKGDLQHGVGNISLTVDIWSLHSQQLYLAMTAHYIVEVSGSLQFMSVLIGFHHLRDKHTGKALTHTILYLLDQARITTKV
ncbi:hypothetical protein PISMIDRAFT_35225, partial [Pisolithus microcarpus 441]